MKSNRQIKKLLSAFLVFILNSGTVNANWTLDHLASDKTLGSALQDARLQELEAQLFDDVKNSWCSKEKAKLLVEFIIMERPQVCVEVGTFTGASALPILTALNYLQVGHAYLIDAWSSEEAVKGLDKEDPNAVWWSKLDMDAVKNQLLEMIKTRQFISCCTVIHAPSHSAVSTIGSIDFLHLDGNFSEEGALLDTQLYLPKVKSGGFILLSNVLVTVNQKPTKMRALWPLFDRCEIVSEIENGNAILFKKN